MAKRRAAKRTQAVLNYPPHWFSPEELLTFVELRPFSKRWDDLGLTDQDMGCLQTLIMVDPEAAPVISGTGGLRKMRCGRANAAKGKSDGYRVCYVYFKEYGTVLMVLIYPKSEQDDIPEGYKAVIRKTIARIERDLASRPYRIGPARGKGEDE